jgi:hypothetical protein
VTGCQPRPGAKISPGQPPPWSGQLTRHPLTGPPRRRLPALSRP